MFRSVNFNFSFQWIFPKTTIKHPPIIAALKKTNHPYPLSVLKTQTLTQRQSKTLNQKWKINKTKATQTFYHSKILNPSPNHTITKNHHHFIDSIRMIILVQQGVNCLSTIKNHHQKKSLTHFMITLILARFSRVLKWRNMIEVQWIQRIIRSSRWKGIIRFNSKKEIGARLLVRKSSISRINKFRLMRTT